MSLCDVTKTKKMSKLTVIQYFVVRTFRVVAGRCRIFLGDSGCCSLWDFLVCWCVALRFFGVDFFWRFYFGIFGMVAGQSETFLGTNGSLWDLSKW